MLYHYIVVYFLCQAFILQFSPAFLFNNIYRLLPFSADIAF
ncbi:hypothetical protein COPEUT_00034 [Coprococcus eutactus ATCC 27759]|nr:hypothetical protein COPEUT_00034 [Coprococcus eutactus ATCC 27759]